MAFIDTIKDEARELAEVVSGISFKKSYIPPRADTLPKIVGFNEQAFQFVDKSYQVVIENSEWRIYAWLQENFEFSVGSHWEPLLNLGIFKGVAGAIDGVGDTVVKALTGYTLKNVAMTRRKWKGSDPLRLKMKLKFRAYEDAEREVLQPIQALQSMTLPMESQDERNLKANESNAHFPGILIPPGPNETFIDNERTRSFLGKTPGFTEAAKAQKVGQAGDTISIDLFGGKFYLDQVLILNVSSSFDPKLTSKGPVAAEADVILESYEMLTKGKLLKAYQGIGYITQSGRGAAGRVERPRG